jgi:hypothetical protein
MKNAPVFRLIFSPIFFALSLGIVVQAPAAPAPDPFGTHIPFPGITFPFPSEEEDEAGPGAGLPQIDPDILWQLRPDIRDDILSRHRFQPWWPAIPDVDDDPPLPEETSDPVPSEGPEDVPEVPEVPPVGPSDPTGSTAPATASGTDSGPSPTGSIPTVQIPAAGGCSLQIIGN